MHIIICISSMMGQGVDSVLSMLSGSLQYKKNRIIYSKNIHRVTLICINKGTRIIYTNKTHLSRKIFLFKLKRWYQRIRVRVRNICGNFRLRLCVRSIQKRIQYFLSMRTLFNTKGWIRIHSASKTVSSSPPSSTCINKYQP